MANPEINIHHGVDVQPIGLQLFNIANMAWQSVLAGSGDYYDRRYNGLPGIGLALLTSEDRAPRESEADNPLGYMPVTPDLNFVIDSGGIARNYQNLAERGSIDPGKLRYRYNHEDSDAEFDPSLLGLPATERISDSILRHGRYTINGAAKRLLLLSRPNTLSSYDPSSIITGISGTLGAAGGIRLLNGKGVAAVSGGNQVHDHVLVNHYAWMAEGALERKLRIVSPGDVLPLSLAVSDSLKDTFDHIKDYVLGEYKARLDELEHHQIGDVLQETNRFLSSHGS